MTISFRIIPLSENVAGLRSRNLFRYSIGLELGQSSIRKGRPRSPGTREPAEAVQGERLDQGLFEPLTRPSRLAVPLPSS
jgi:hypothetical protein